jgi:hypothetical protein
VENQVRQVREMAADTRDKNFTQDKSRKRKPVEVCMERYPLAETGCQQQCVGNDEHPVSQTPA